MPLTHLNPPTVYPPARNAYSVAVISTGSRHVHRSGVVGRNKDGKLEGDGGMAAQMRTCMDNVVKILEAAGAKAVYAFSDGESLSQSLAPASSTAFFAAASSATKRSIS